MGLMSVIEGTVAAFRAGEAEVAREFFSQPRPMALHVSMLRHQLSRELRNLREISEGELTDMVVRVDRDFSRQDIVAELREHYYETRHYAMLADVLEGLLGEHVDWQVLNAQRSTADWSNPWSAKESQRRREWSAITPLHGAAGSFNSGGAGSVAYGMIHLNGGIYEELLAATAKIILHDEMAHGDVLGSRNPLYELVKTEEDATVAVDIIEEHSTIRLKGRNHQFGFPISEQRVEAIIHGDIEPATIEVLQSAYEGAIDEEEWFDRYNAAPKPLSAASVLR